MLDLLLNAGVGVLEIQGLKSIFGLANRNAKIAALAVGIFLFVLYPLLPLVNDPTIKNLTAIAFRALMIFALPGAYAFGKALFVWLKMPRAK